MAKIFLSYVDYYKGSEASVVIERQMQSPTKVEAETDSLGAPIGSAWYEGFDLGMKGTVRKLHDAHATLLGDFLLITKAVEIAIRTEDFAESLLSVMSKIGDASMKLVDSAGELLMSVTDSATDGNIINDEEAQLVAKGDAVAANRKELAKDFDAGRRNWAPIRKELLNEFCFVFAISA